ncbi:MAG TPA: RraA family protein [Mycobacteriales bacterium]|nr:RraA family protein [Mycobacteriales bacterium]
MKELPDWLASTVASDATEGRGVIDTDLIAFSPERTVVGPALVVKVSRDDNVAMADVPAAVAGPGMVLVVAGGHESRTAVLGDLVARELLAAGVTAVVTDAPIRDSRAVAELGLAVWARKSTPTKSSKNGPGSVGGSVEIGGVRVSDGDIVVADADGVVVWPQAEVGVLLEKAEAKQRADAERLAKLTAR